VNLAFWPEALYVIIGVMDPDAPDLRAYRIADQQIEEVPLEVME
jgi:hypothetical protein